MTRWWQPLPKVRTLCYACYRLVSLEGTAPCLCWLSPPLSYAVPEQMSIFSWFNYSKPIISSLVLGTWFYHPFHWEDKFARQEEITLSFQSFSLVLQWRNGPFSCTVHFLVCLLGLTLSQGLEGPNAIPSSSCPLHVLLVTEFFTSRGECVVLSYPRLTSLVTTQILSPSFLSPALSWAASTHLSPFHLPALWNCTSDTIAPIQNNE